jgi:hypothetical protein
MSSADNSEKSNASTSNERGLFFVTLGCFAALLLFIAFVLHLNWPKEEPPIIAPSLSPQNRPDKGQLLPGARPGHEGGHRDT